MTRKYRRPLTSTPAGRLLSLLLLLALVVIVGWLQGDRPGDLGTGRTDLPMPGQTPAEPTVSQSASGSFSGLPTIAFPSLPRQAQETIALIDEGGPFPFDRDGLVFQNREGILPARSRGYYREYTVVTPGESDRGARRIVAGAGGDLYYTDDHYTSFREVLR